MGKIELLPLSQGNELSSEPHGQNPVVMPPSLGPRSLAHLSPPLPWEIHSCPSKPGLCKGEVVHTQLVAIPAVVDSIWSYMPPLLWDG